MRYTRREVGRIALGGLGVTALWAGARSTAAQVAGVRLGVITYSFRALPDGIAVLNAVRSIGIDEVELMFNDAEQLLGAPKEPESFLPGRRETPEQASARRETNAALVRWRAGVDTSQFARVTTRFKDAGAKLNILCHNFEVSHDDARIDYAFRMARGLGVPAISTTTRVSVAKRIAPFADRHQIRVGFHNHDWTDRPDEFATPESLTDALQLSRYHAINLDIGHFVAAGYDPVPFIERHHDRITNLHIKDRRRNRGATVPFGQGDVPIAAVLQLLKKNGWPIPANIEFEYSGDPLVEVPKCLEFCRKAIA
jgi:sugar phosphate isomerase/epimerase